MRAAKFPRNLTDRSRLAVSQQIERGNLREREFTRCQLLRRRQHQLAPEAANGDDAPADLTEALSATRHLIKWTLPHLAAGDTHRRREATAKPFGGLGDLRDTAATRCMHMRIH